MPLAAVRSQAVQSLLCSLDKPHTSHTRPAHLVLPSARVGIAVTRHRGGPEQATAAPGPYAVPRLASVGVHRGVPAAGRLRLCRPTVTPRMYAQHMSNRRQQTKSRRTVKFELRSIRQAIESAEGTDSHLERIRQLSIVSRTAQARIDSETIKARENGSPWSSIGGVQGVSGQAAQRKNQRRRTQVDDVSGVVGAQTASEL